MDRTARRLGTTRANVRASMAIFLSALLALALFKSDRLVSYTYDLPQGAVASLVVPLAEGWNRWMNALGTAGLTRVAARTMERLSSPPDEFDESDEPMSDEPFDETSGEAFDETQMTDDPEGFLEPDGLDASEADDPAETR